MFHVKHLRYFSYLLILPLLLISSLLATNRAVAEWEPMRGVLIRHPFGISTQLIRSFSTSDTVYILVQNQAAQNQAISTLSAGNVNLGMCRFIIAPTNSHWTRDWGPHSVFQDDENLAILDPIFDGYPWVPGREDNRPYELDDEVNSILSTYFQMPLIEFPAYLTGGNFMTDGYGIAYSTAQMINENFPLMNSDAFLDLASSALGLADYRFTINPEFHGIQHIDCWAKFLNEETVLVKQLPSWHPEYSRAESVASQFSQETNCYGNPYRVLRIFCDTYSGNDAAAYTNSLILNNRVFVPTFGIDADQTALQTYIDAMPGYEVIGFPGSWYYYDALHCRTMGIADGEMLRLTHIPLPVITELTSDELSIEVNIKSYGNHPLVPASLQVLYRSNLQPNWQSLILTAGDQPGIYQAVIPGLQDGEELQYYFVAEDLSGRNASAPVNAPGSFFFTQLSIDPVGLNEPTLPQASFRVYPNPIRNQLSIKTETPGDMILSAVLYNLRGQNVYHTPLSYSQYEDHLTIYLEDASLPNGIYILKLRLKSGYHYRRLAIIH